MATPPFTAETAKQKVKRAQNLWNTKAKEKNYVLRKELFAFTDNKIAVQFWYEYQDAHDGMKWKRCYGLEDWTFAEDGRMRKRQMSGNDVLIGPDGNGDGRWFKGLGEEGKGVAQEAVDAVQIGEEHW
ncbi:hypothetical protein FH972_026270 [Carpinus fangiana]|uniref:DUF1348 domain-containing protein n=1 Tax=Carpinus fangiana TaxID=176857 RepID=A0A5N6L3N2_9ROSI|nr:hypothetical protein FH972_026270 [Carpinus fangiana]